jgi:acetyltransferase
VKQIKPIVVLKTGRTVEGARAAASHTGSLAASDRVVDAAFQQYGIVRAERLCDFMGIAKAFAWQPLPKGRRVGIITFSGALGVMALDEMNDAGLELARFSPATVSAISALMPEWQPVQNPADVWMALGNDPGRAHERILTATLADPQVDLVLCILLPIPNTDFANVKAVFSRLKRVGKPVFLVMMGGHVKKRWLEEIETLRIPNFPEPRAAVVAMKAMCFYAERRARPCPDPLWEQPERFL